MKYGFIKAAAASPKLKVGDTVYNLEQAKKCFDEAEDMGANLLVLPELYVAVTVLLPALEAYAVMVA